MGRPLVNRANQQFGRLTVIRATDERKNNEVVWECLCDCGNVILVKGGDLQSGETKSCGCFRRDRGRETAPKAAKVSVEKNCIENTDIRQLNNNLQKNNRSGRNGVYWNNQKQKWCAELNFAKKRYYLGAFQDFADAVRAREEAEEKYFAPMLAMKKTAPQEG